MEDELILNVKDLNYRIGSRYLLKEINWQIRRGEKWLLFGLNGCGKTTLLSVIAGWRGGFSGEVQVLGEQYSRDNILSLRQRIAFVSSSFFDKIFANESLLNIVLSGRNGTLSCGYAVPMEERQKAQRLLAQFHLAGREDHSYHWLSKGERQSVLLARAMMSKAELLILDEPCSGLDIAARNRLLAQLRNIAETPEKTIIYVTHYAEEILAEFTHVVLMAEGKIIQQGAAGDILQDDCLTKFLQMPVELHWQNGCMQLACNGEG